MMIIFKYVLAAAMAFAGTMHFIAPKGFEAIVPRVLPAKRALVYLSGLAEITLAIGLLIPAISSLAAWGLIALYIAVFPANVSQAMRGIPYGKSPKWLIWARLPLQAGLIAWAYAYT